MDVQDLLRRAGFLDEPEGIAARDTEPQEIERAYQYVLADPKFQVGTRPTGPLSLEAKRFIVQMYEQFTGKAAVGIVMTRTLEEFCDGLMTDDEPMTRLESGGICGRVQLPSSACRDAPPLRRLTDTFEQAGIGRVSPAKLPGDLRGIHYPLPDGSRAIHYQEGQWEASSEYTVLHEGYEIVYETLWLRCHGEASTQRVCPEADRFAAAVLMPPDTFAAYALASGLDVAALKNVFRCSYSAVAIRLGEVMGRQPLLAVLYERKGAGRPGMLGRSPTQAGRPAGYGD